MERFLEEYKLNSSQLADILGVQRSGISHILAGRNKPSFDFLVRIIENFPEINAKWLITGKGRMFSSDGEDELKPSRGPAMPSLFDSLEPAEEKKEIVSHPKQNEGLKEEPLNSQMTTDSENKSVYKSKQDDSQVDGIDMVMVLYRSGKFRRYIPE